MENDEERIIRNGLSDIEIPKRKKNIVNDIEMSIKFRDVVAILNNIIMDRWPVNIFSTKY